MIYDTLRDFCLPPRYHGNGMIQLYLTGDTRLHVHTSPDGSVPDHNARVHDHQFHMTSHVLWGTLCHELYGFDSRASGPDDLRILTDSSKIADGSVTLDRGKRRLVHRFEMPSHSIYTQSARTLHNSYPLRSGTVTVIRKTPDKIPVRARLVCPRGQEPHSAFGVENPDEEWMWSQIESAIKRVEYSGDIAALHSFVGVIS